MSGAIAAGVVGYGHLATPLKLFGSSMIVFYLLGSRATKVSYQLLRRHLRTAKEADAQVKAAYKATLEDGPDPSKPGGNRNAMQVNPPQGRVRPGLELS